MSRPHLKQVVAYDLGAYDWDRHWSVGNFASFAAPMRDTAVSAILAD